MIKLTCLYNADGEVVGYFSDYPAEVAARKEWHEHYDQRVPLRQSKLSLGLVCRSKETAIVAAEVENVEPGDGDRVDYLKGLPTDVYLALELNVRIGMWLHRGAISVEVQRFLINKYRRSGMSVRDADLGGPTDAAGVLYVLKIKAPR
mgnify:CR=1 FL=1